MNTFFRKKPATNSNTVRKETVVVPVSRPVNKKQPPSQGANKNPTARVTGPPQNRFQLSERRASTPPSNKNLQKPAQRAIASSRGVKRKSATPQPERPLFSDDEDEYDTNSSDIGAGASDSDISRKKVKSSVSSLETTGPPRHIALQDKDEDGDLDYVHSADLTSGVYASKYGAPWEDDRIETISLTYPGKGRPERFELKWPKQGPDEYKPFDDMKETIKFVAEYYLPPHLREQNTDDSSGLERRLNRAWQRQSASEWVSVCDEYNRLVAQLTEDGSIQRVLEDQQSLDLELVKRILDQIYSRTVSLKVEKLRAYKIGTDNVYGELLPRFVREIFDETRLRHDQVFVDLGSGVGNVVLQAALDVGCESWGIEMMKMPCELAELQAKEFAARSRLWGISVGKVSLLQGDFTESVKIVEVLKRADLVLVNNQAFTSALNEKLTAMFLDLKDGAKVVSLKPFVPEGHRIAARNIGSPINQFTQARYVWYPDYVSWGGNGGHYYVATKDSRPLQAFMRKHNLG